MSAYRELMIWCNGVSNDGEPCLKWDDGYGFHAKVDDLREVLADRGWTRRPNGEHGRKMDYCPECSRRGFGGSK